MHLLFTRRLLIPYATLAFVLTWLCAVPAHAQRAKTKVVRYEYTFVAGNSMSPQQAKQVAIERAQLQAIADEFGTIIANTTTTRVENLQAGGDVKSTTQVLSLGQSDVRGEWVRDLSEPVCTTEFDAQLGMVVHVCVHGEIRERVRAEIALKVLTLRNGTTERFQDTSFSENDDLYLLFRSTTDGYLTVYLADADNAYCLLPYQYQTESAMPIRKDEEYVFFSIDKAPAALQPVVDEYHLTCGPQVELNRIYVVFSPQEFTKAVDIAGDGVLPRNLSLKDFHRWLGKARAYDARMTCRAIDIDIQPK